MANTPTLSRFNAQPDKTGSGYSLLLIATFCTGSLPIAIRFGLNESVPIIVMLATRTIMAATIIGLLLLLFRRHDLRYGWTLAGRCLVLASINCGTMLASFHSLKYVDVSFALLGYLVAFMLFAIGWTKLLGQATQANTWLRFTIASIGILLFVQPTGKISLIGIGLILGNAFGFSLYSTLYEKWFRDVPAWTATCYLFSIMALIFTTAAFLTDQAWPRLEAGAAWWSMLWIGIISTALARVTYLRGIYHVGSRMAALFSPVELIVGVGLAILLLDEQLSAIQLLGTALVIASVLLARWNTMPTSRLQGVSKR